MVNLQIEECPNIEEGIINYCYFYYKISFESFEVIYLLRNEVVVLNAFYFEYYRVSEKFFNRKSSFKCE